MKRAKNTKSQNTCKNCFWRGSTVESDYSDTDICYAVPEQKELKDLNNTCLNYKPSEDYDKEFWGIKEQ